jgi:FkbM family methyltransferase
VNIVKFLKRPEYVLRPRQVLYRFRRTGKKVPSTARVALPWGASVQVSTAENVGIDIFCYGIFDKIVPEAIWRLAGAGEIAVDIGANIGQNTSAMAFKCGPQGRTIAFEPHPVTFPILAQNANGWRNANCSPVELNNVALGESDGEATLVSDNYLSGSSLTKQGKGVTVSVRRLDDFLRDLTVGVCKIDVEGHELAVLKGAQQTLKRRAIRDLIFEDFNPKPSPVTEFLTQHGFEIFELHENWIKPRLSPMSLVNAPAAGFSSNYLATLDSKRALKRFRSPGWRCLLNL